MNAPQAKKINKSLQIHGDERIDPYFWLNERENPEVTEYLNAENKYCDFVMENTENFQEELYEEMKARYKKDDESLPYFFNGYWYIVKYEDGKEYPIFLRKPETLEHPEELIIDVNVLAEGETFFEVGSVAVSPNNEIASFSSDNIGRRIYTIQFKNLKTGDILQDQIPNTTGKAVWANDNRHVFYTRKDKNLRAYQIYLHELGTDSSQDILVFHEKDDTFDVNVYKTKSLEYIFIASSSTISDEHRFIPADNVLAEWKILQPREEDLEYAVEHFEDEFYIITNADDAINFKIVKTKVENCRKENWKDVIPHRKEVLLEGFEIFKNYLVLEERNEGLLQIKIIENQTGKFHYLPFSDPTYTSYIGLNLEFNTEILRYGYTSLTVPSSTFEYNMK